MQAACFLFYSNGKMTVNILQMYFYSEFLIKIFLNAFI